MKECTLIKIKRNVITTFDYSRIIAKEKIERNETFYLVPSYPNNPRPNTNINV